MALLSFDLSGLPLLEAEVAALVAQQQAAPSSFVGGQSFGVTGTALKSGILPGGIAVAAPSATMTTSLLIQRLSALLQLAQTLPQ